MYCRRCEMILYPEEAINYGICESCYDKYLESDEEETIEEFIKKQSR